MPMMKKGIRSGGQREMAHKVNTADPRAGCYSRLPAPRRHCFPVTSRRTLPLAIPGLVLLLAACATRQPEPAPAPPPPDYRPIMGEPALARAQRAVASRQYLDAAMRLRDPGVARRATLIALLAGDMQQARRAAGRWESLAPHDLEAAQYQALLHARAGETEEALHYFLRIADGATGETVGANLQ